MPKSEAFTIGVDLTDVGKRLDTLVTSRIPDYSRSLVAHHIRIGNIQVDGTQKKPGYRVRPGERVTGNIPAPEPVGFNPEPIPLHILYEDAHIIVVNKPPGLVVHPAPGHRSGTLVNGLFYHCPTLEGVGPRLRPGIVHRLDKDTSGTLVVAKNGTVHQHLAKQFKQRTIEKRYLALVCGELKTDSGTILLPIGRHPIHRKEMSTRGRKTRNAETVWEVRERFDGVTLLEVVIKTGRTHQIRVHCAAILHPIIGDPVYGRRRMNKGRVRASRQMLHAWRLGFTHPATGEWVVFESPIAEDMEALIERLRKETKTKFEVPKI